MTEVKPDIKTETNAETTQPEKNPMQVEQEAVIAILEDKILPILSGENLQRVANVARNLNEFVQMKLSDIVKENKLDFKIGDKIIK